MKTNEKWDRPRGKKYWWNECLYTPWLHTDHLVVFVPWKKKVGPLTKRFPQSLTTHDAIFSPLSALMNNACNLLAQKHPCLNWETTKLAQMRTYSSFGSQICFFIVDFFFLVSYLLKTTSPEACPMPSQCRTNVNASWHQHQWWWWHGKWASPNDN
jgi:hypothetical protein